MATLTGSRRTERIEGKWDHFSTFRGVPRCITWSRCEESVEYFMMGDSFSCLAVNAAAFG